MPTDPTVLTPEQAERALRTFIRDVRPGSCRIFSRGSTCDCPLCLLDTIADRNSQELLALRQRAKQAEAALARVQAERDEARAAVADLSREYHAAINEPEYAGTRADWQARAMVAEGELARLYADVRKLREQL